MISQEDSIPSGDEATSIVWLEISYTFKAAPPHKRVRVLDAWLLGYLDHTCGQKACCEALRSSFFDDFPS